MHNRRAALCTYFALIRVVPAANRAFNRVFELGLLVAPLAPRAARPTVRHSRSTSIPNTRFAQFQSKLPKLLRSRRLRRTRSLRCCRRRRTRGFRLVVETLRRQGNLSRTRCCGGNGILSGLQGSGEIGAALLAGGIGRLVESATLEALNNVHRRCRSKTHSCSFIITNERGPTPRTRGLWASAQERSSSTAQARRSKSAGSPWPSRPTRPPCRTSCRQPGNGARTSEACPFPRGRRTGRTAR